MRRMTSCEYFNELVCLAFDNEIDPQEEKILKAHLEICPECNSLFEAYGRLSENLTAAQVEPPELLASEIMQKVRRISGRKRRRIAEIARVAAFAAVIVAVIFAADMIVPMGDKSATFENAAHNQEDNLFYSMAEESLLPAFDADAAHRIVPVEAEENKESESDRGNSDKEYTETELGGRPDETHNQENSDQLNKEVEEIESEAAPSEPAPSSYGFSNMFEYDTQARDIWVSNSFEKVYYCVATISNIAADELIGYEQLSKSDKQIYYKVPVDVIEIFQEKKSFSEILFNNRDAEYGIVIVNLD